MNLFAKRNYDVGRGRAEIGGLLIASDERSGVKKRAMPLFQISLNEIPRKEALIYSQWKFEVRGAVINVKKNIKRGRRPDTVNYTAVTVHGNDESVS